MTVYTVDGALVTVYILKMLVYSVTKQVTILCICYNLFSIVTTYLSDCDLLERNRTNINIRLTGSPQPGSGRVEILVGDQWGTICDVFWGLADAEVACRDLGYSGALQATGRGCKYQCMNIICTSTYICIDFGEGTGPIHRTQVTCQGFEPTIFTCPAQHNTSACDHSMDAGVICISELYHNYS